MKKFTFAVMLLLSLSIVLTNCESEAQLQKIAITYMQEQPLFEGGQWYAGEWSVDELEKSLVEFGAPDFKRGQHAVEVVVNFLEMNQSYVVWIQDNKVLYYEMTGHVTPEKIELVIYPELRKKGWRE